ncbi:glcG protein [Mergibacter septicus]|uniref:GlcG protein n=1 Tax=Mergibacter septicus TaxID=221402 RepID=A0A8E3S7L1_9PAST|nr:heme-binding protein [Mergibacter septicus]AWX14000.1 glcG protein [Mergibacter septicus]AWX14852.1 glcG protein [Mergibacter septicus]QDJ13472.1 glcG protein [Mergibacter septicus]QDJ14104.1 glcG protein [Mergibacter septicus]UTU48446.1 heme-binding protein [Mergibacter septicus]
MKKFFMILLAMFLPVLSIADPNIVRKPVLTIEQVEGMINAAQKEAKKHKWNVTVTVVDASGVILGVLRNDNAGVHTIRASYKKAYTAVSQKRTTKSISDGIKEGKIPAGLQYLNENFSFLDGGMPIILDGVVVGGIGVGGAHGSQDIQVAEAGLAFLKK